IFALTIIAIAFQSMALNCNETLMQADMNQCTGNSFALVKEKLEATYKKVLEKVEKHQRELFEKSQMAWEIYRGSECAFAASGAEEGTAQSMIYANCLQGHAIERNEKLESYLTCPEGDLLCPFINN
ncbi:hypothetical protein DJ468_01580, partial [Candidatus Liberibacter asiaticus]